MTVSDFLEQFGGARPVARELGLPHTTVASWVQRNHVPEWRMAKLAELAVKRGVPLPAAIGRAAEKAAA